MSAYAVNLVTQLYVANNKVTRKDLCKNLGDVYVGKTKDGLIYINQYGHGGLTRSDLIDPCQVKWAKYVTAGSQKTKTQAWKVTPNAEALAEQIGKDVLLRVDIKNFCGDLSSNHHYFKHAVVRVKKYMLDVTGDAPALTATNTATSPALVALMATQLAKSFARDCDPMVAVYVDTTKVEKNTKPEDLTVTANSVITLKALRPEFDAISGVGLNEQLDFEVYCGSYNDAIDEEVWGEVTKADGYAMSNTANIVSLEAFAMKERGDIYGYMGWPYVKPSKLMLPAPTAGDRAADDPDAGYDVVNIHFYYEGANEQPHKSEKDLVIVGSAVNDVKTALAGAGIRFEVVSIDSESGKKDVQAAANIADVLADTDVDGTADVLA